MHKIKVEQNSVHLKSEEVFLTSFLDSLKLYVIGEVYCAINNFQNQSLEVYLEENSHLTLEFFLEVENSKNKIKINTEANSQLDLHYACLYSKENELIVENNVSKDNNRNILLFRLVEKNGSLTVKAVGKIEKNTKNNAYLEDIKAITTNENHLKIMPDLKVSSNLVLASHNATIGPVDREALFYLESKGLDKKAASTLIKEGFLKGVINEEVFKN